MPAAPRAIARLLDEAGDGDRTFIFCYRLKRRSPQYVRVSEIWAFPGGAGRPESADDEAATGGRPPVAAWQGRPRRCRTWPLLVVAVPTDRPAGSRAGGGSIWTSRIVTTIAAK